MIPNIKLEYFSESGLESVEYSFWFDDYTLWLESYIEYSRPTKRHSFKPTRSYYRIDKRHTNMTVEEVNLAEDVKQDAVKKVIEQLQVKLWDKP